MTKVIYLTGAPAAGKSSTVKLLSDRISNIEIWEYGARLKEHIGKKNANINSQEDLRHLSSKLVKPHDVAFVDNLLVSYVNEHRGISNVIIDTHAVTKESYGFRITPFSLKQFEELAPDEIWMLYTNPEVAIQRINNDPGGRPMIDAEQARMHTALQASVSATYGMTLGVAVYLFDSSGPQDALVDLLAARLA